MSVERVIKIVQYFSPPYANACSNITNCEHPGIETLLLMMKLQAMKFRLEFVTVEAKHMFEALRNGSGDITGFTNPLTPVYYNGVCPTNPVINDKALLVMKLKKTENQNLLFSMCDIEVWLLLLCVFVVILGIKLLANKIHKSSRSASMDPLPKVDATHAAWGLIFTVIFYTYTSFLTLIFSQKVAVPIPFRSFRSFTEHLASGACRLYTNGSTIPDIPDLLPRGQSYMDFAKAVDRWPILAESDETSLVNRVMSGDCNVGLIYESERPLYEAMSCNLQFVNFDQFPTVSYVFYYRCDYPHAYPLSKLEASTDYYVDAMNAYAKYSFVKQKMYENDAYLRSECFEEHGQVSYTNVVESLKLWQLVDSFLLLLGGIIVGGLILVATQTSTRIRRLFSYFGKLLEQNK